MVVANYNTNDFKGETTMDILNPMGLEVRCKKINGEDYFSMRDLAEVRVREGKQIKHLGRNFCCNEGNFRMIPRH